MTEQEKEKCEWKSKYDTLYKCHETSLSDGYCILHSWDEKDIGQFTDKVKERITKGTLTPSGWEIDKTDLKGCYFPRDFDKEYFRGCQFNKPVDFSEATFSQVVHFTEAKFFKEAYFTGTKFLQNADFSKAEFSQKANFYKVEFSEASFEKATFSQEASFFRATFSQMVSFALAKFFEEAYFNVARFLEKAYFNGAKFTEGRFISTCFEKGAEFDNAEFGERAFFEQVDFGPGSSFQYTRFLGEATFQDVNLSNCSFLHSNIDEVDFRYCEFAEAKGRKNVLRDELEADEEVKKVESWVKDENVIARDAVPKQSLFYTVGRLLRFARNDTAKKERYEPVRRLYLELKKNFEDKKDWNTAGDFHYGEMECRRKMKGWWGRNLLSLEAVYYWASGYGERPWRAFVVLAILVLFVFPVLLSLNEFLCSFWTSFKDSLGVATFVRFTRILEPVKPGNPWDTCLLVVESIIAYIQIALFALALRRKVKR